MIAGALFVLPASGAAQVGGMQAWQEQTVAHLVAYARMNQILPPWSR